LVRAKEKVPVPSPDPLSSSTSTVQVPVLSKAHVTASAGDAQADVPPGRKKSISGASVPFRDVSVAVSV
jgi:hypothetical protein